MLRDYQQEAVEALVRFFRTNPTGNPLIVAPTASGKSHIIAGFIERVLRVRPNAKFLVCAHRQELVEQNASKMNVMADVGIYSAGLRSKKIAQITFATIGSVFRRAAAFAGTDVLIIDEAHLVPNKGAGMYRTLIQGMGKVRVIGLTATPYRLDSGHLVNTQDEFNIFTEVVYSIDMLKLIKDGILSPIITKSALRHADTQSLPTRRGEFAAKETEDLFVKIIDTQCQEIIKFGEGRKSWLIFCSGVRHSELVAEALVRNGIKAVSVTGNNSKEGRGPVIAAFKRGEIQCLTNCDVLTTGFDAPNCDMLALLRPTQSTGLYVQMVGRGMRIAPGKTDCLLLDFGENIERHGPIDDVRPTKGRRDDVQLIRVCKVCRGVSNIKAKACEQCGADFMKTCRECGVEVPLRVAEKLDRCPECQCSWHLTRNPGGVEASALAALSTYSKYELNWYDVLDVAYSVHNKPGSPPSLRVSYYINVDGRETQVNRFVCLEHGGYPTQSAIRWVYEACLERFRKDMTDVNSTQQLYAKTNCLKKPLRVRAKKEGKWWEIKKFEYPPDENYVIEKVEDKDEWDQFMDSLTN